MSEVVVIGRAELASMLKEAVCAGVAEAMRRLQKSAPREMDEAEAAEYLGMSRATLRCWRSLGRGPAFHKYSRNVRYSKSDLDAWLALNRVQTADSLGMTNEKAN